MLRRTLLTRCRDRGGSNGNHYSYRFRNQGTRVDPGIPVDRRGSPGMFLLQVFLMSFGFIMLASLVFKRPQRIEGGYGDVGPNPYMNAHQARNFSARPGSEYGRPPPPPVAPRTTPPPNELAYWDGYTWQPLKLGADEHQASPPPQPPSQTR
ncbi:hypothetical protein DIPPA_22519 [Diplonema papillatum]|nr:hypothetical protein DIPPA_22519 [Diplonema papillatum]